jgi:hypothetical protein
MAVLDFILKGIFKNNRIFDTAIKKAAIFNRSKNGKSVKTITDAI